MAQADSEFLKVAEYAEDREKQAGDIRREFERQTILLTALIENGNRQIQDKIRGVEARMSQEGRSQQDEMGEIKARVNQMAGRSFNKSRYLPWHTIEKTGAYKLPTGFITPEYFPSTIKEFWNLQFKSNIIKCFPFI